MALYWFVLLPILAAITSYLLHLKYNKYLLLFFQLGFLGFAIMNMIKVKTNGPIIQTIGHHPLGVGISFQSDMISALLVLTTIFIFTLLILFNSHKPYMTHLFLFLFLILQGLINGIFLSNDLFNIYIMVELSSIVVSILIIFKKDSKFVYDGILYFLTNLGAMTLFLLGLGFIYRIFGTMDMTQIQESMLTIQNQEVLLVPFVLLMTAASLKSAVMPLFSWLPKAHCTASAPSIISAVLSGLYVKGGIYLFIRISNLFSYSFDVHLLFLILGFSTAIVGIIFALSQQDIKLILAYSTISQVGLILFGLSTANIYSYFGAVYHIFNHAVFKTALFLIAGIIIENYGTRNIKDIRGLAKKIPFVAIVLPLAIFGITGAPLFNGSVSKYMLQKGSTFSSLYEVGFAIINLGTITIFVKFASILFGESSEKIKLLWNQKVALIFLTGICFIGGIAGPSIVSFLFDFDFIIYPMDYLEKLLLYMGQVILTLLFYRFLDHRMRWFASIREIELSFNQIIGSMFVFLTLFIAYMTFIM